MPYITPDLRNALDPKINALWGMIALRGELAYAIYRLVLPSKSYVNFSSARAVLKDVYDVITAEFLAYEAMKRVENGDINL